MEPNADYCPINKRQGYRVHKELSDWSYWNEENHPACWCGYIDKTRKIRENLPG